MNTPTMIPVIAIDGPTASGKGAVAQAVARELHFGVVTRCGQGLGQRQGCRRGLGGAAQGQQRGGGGQGRKERT